MAAKIVDREHDLIVEAGRWNNATPVVRGQGVILSSRDSVTGEKVFDFKSADTDATYGVSMNDAAQGEDLDVLILGSIYVVIGAAINANAIIHAQTDGDFITSAPAAGVNQRVDGYMQDDASAGSDGQKYLAFINCTGLQIQG